MRVRLTKSALWQRRGTTCSQAQSLFLRQSPSNRCAGTWPGDGNAELETRVSGPTQAPENRAELFLHGLYSQSASKLITAPAHPNLYRLFHSLYSVMHYVVDDYFFFLNIPIEPVNTDHLAVQWSL